MMHWRRFVAVSITLVSIIALYQIMNARTFQIVGRLVSHVPSSEKVIALTFDDGPDPIGTAEILAMLQELNVKATFFVTGAELEQHMPAGRQIVAAGHALGNHSYSHQRMVLVTPTFVRDEIARTDQRIREAGYTGEIYFRPPHGKKLVVLPAYLARTNRTTVMWDIEPESDPRVAQDSTAIADQVVKQARPGSIILLHVMYPSRHASRTALRDIVLRLQDEGYRFVTIPELLDMQPQP
jgi:peptidoglycan/xylan/chitin deacetylase (PgdA/CDA1 family)